jgi:hypothetical protein
MESESVRRLTSVRFQNQSKTKCLEFCAQNGACSSYKTILRLLKNALSLNQNALMTKSSPLFASWDITYPTRVVFKTGEKYSANKRLIVLIPVIDVIMPF